MTKILDTIPEVNFSKEETPRAIPPRFFNYEINHNDLPPSLTIGKSSLGQKLQDNSINQQDSFSYDGKALKLTSLPIQFLSIETELQYIDFSVNSFCEIPMEIFNLKNLRCLRMDNNVINSVPSSLSRLSELEILTLSCNSIHFVTPEIKKLKIGRAHV